MPATVLQVGGMSVLDYRCDAASTDLPYAEVHERFSLSYVRRGSFGCHARGRNHELVAGAFLIGAPGDEFTCTHDHQLKDECLSFQFSPDLIEEIGSDLTIWRAGAVPPLPELIV